MTDSLREIRELANANAQFTVVTGRRRIWKTSLLWKAYEDEPILCVFVARKSESDLCEDYLHEVESKLGVPTIGRVENEIDNVAENEFQNKATFVEVRRKAGNINVGRLKEKALPSGKPPTRSKTTIPNTRDYPWRTCR